MSGAADGSLAPAPSVWARARSTGHRAGIGLRHRPIVAVGLLIIGLWVVCAIFAPWIARYGPLDQTQNIYGAPSATHWFGTDNLGRDVFARVLYGARLTLPFAVIIVVLSALLGAVLGGIAGYFGGVVDGIIMRIADLFFAFPTIIMAMAIVAALGPSLRNAMIAIIVRAWPIYARVTRGLVLSARNSEYVLVSRLAGASGWRVLRTDITPNVIGQVASLSLLELGSAMLWLAGLSFLGLGAQPPAPEWGAMVSSGGFGTDYWWLATFPGVAILSVVLAANLIGDGLIDSKELEIVGTA